MTIGCKYNAECEILKTSRDDMIVMKGKKVNSLYYIPGETIIGVTRVSSN